MNCWSVSPPEAAQELLRRRQARRGLLDFTRYTFAGFRPEPAHALMAEALGAVVRGECDRLMILAPPQHGKSELASVRLPAFWVGQRPDDPVILSSYAASLAEDKSRACRRVVESQEYATLFPDTRTQSDSRAVHHWQLEGGRGGLLAAGVGGPITGHGALLGIIDDPFENWEQAQSPTIRERVWDWWRTTFRTRIWEGGAVALLTTRWHEDDLAGRLLAERSQRWAVLRLPALAETQEERDAHDERLGLPAGQPDPLGRAPGEPLCPGRFSRAALEEIRRDVGPRAWAAQYQGVPRPAEGNCFKAHWFALVDAVPFQARRVRYWDKAATAGAGCYTCGVLMARGHGIYFVEDVVRGRWSAAERGAVMRDTSRRDAARYGNAVGVWIEQEPGSGGKESAELTVRDLAGYPVHAERVTGSKEVRAGPFAAQAEAGNVRLLRGPWNAAYLDELCMFPGGAYTDQVDASSGASNKLARPRARRGQPVGAPRRETTYLAPGITIPGDGGSPWLRDLDV
jgi:predicted phage terminase large subunit-like protein